MIISGNLANLVKELHYYWFISDLSLLEYFTKEAPAVANHLCQG
jgi:hypothetical protein